MRRARCRLRYPYTTPTIVALMSTFVRTSCVAMCPYADVIGHARSNMIQCTGA